MLNESDIENLIDNASDTDILLIKKFFQLGMNIGQRPSKRFPIYFFNERTRFLRFY